MSWTAIIPVRLGGPRKTRLAGCLTAVEREQLADRLFAHVATTVRTHPQVIERIILSPLRPPASPDRWMRDEGRGLNAELTALREKLPDRDLLVIHADLPLLTHADLSVLFDAAAAGIAIAPDHTGQGTNALAIRREQELVFAFGPASLAAHVAAAGVWARLVVSPGLARDVDTAEDLEFALSVDSAGLGPSPAGPEPLAWNSPT
jgi:2-phospho-L-lactate/phosphoenolpyruvate guanylyltransferase